MSTKDQYELLKWYPGLPKDWEEGMLVAHGDRASGFVAPCNGLYSQRWVDANQVKNNPKFWKRVEPKPFYISAVKLSPDIPMYYDKNGNPQDGGRTLEEDLEDGAEVHQITRSSDGTKLTVGQRIKICDKGNYITKISKISKIRKDGMIGTIEGTAYPVGTEGWNAIHPLVPLVKSKNGLELFPDNTYYWVDFIKNEVSSLIVASYIDYNFISKFEDRYVFEDPDPAEDFLCSDEAEAIRQNLKSIYSKEQVRRALKSFKKDGLRMPREDIFFNQLEISRQMIIKEHS